MSTIDPNRYTVDTVDDKRRIFTIRATVVKKQRNNRLKFNKFVNCNAPETKNIAISENNVILFYVQRHDHVQRENVKFYVPLKVRIRHCTIYVAFTYRTCIFSIFVVSAFYSLF